MSEVINRGNLHTVPFDVDSVKAFLDTAITRWRKLRESNDQFMANISPYYIDAYQSIRTSLFGETLP
jgi:hypothetical protein